MNVVSSPPDTGAITLSSACGPDGLCNCCRQEAHGSERAHSFQFFKHFFPVHNGHPFKCVYSVQSSSRIQLSSSASSTQSCSSFSSLRDVPQFGQAGYFFLKTAPQREHSYSSGSKRWECRIQWGLVVRLIWLPPYPRTKGARYSALISRISFFPSI